MAKRNYDIVLFGATGFTGELTAEYLARAMSRESFSWAVAGRNADKLARVCRRLESINPDCRGRVGQIVADVEDPGSLAAMTAQARVVITTVGPYIHFGEPLVKACVEQGTDYVDLTGEPEFVDNMIHRYGEKARDNKVRIVNSCGFDSIPHDLGAWYTVQELTRDMTRKVAAEQHIQVEGFVRASGTFSGGTWHSAIHAFSRYREFMKEKKAHGKPQGQSDRRRLIRAIPPSLHFHKDLNAWAVPFPTIDPQVVRRSARELDDYGREFSYGHYVQVRKLPKVIAGGAFVSGLFLLSQLKMTRNWLLSFKSQGDGPSRKQIERAWFKVTFKGEMGERRIKTMVRGGDPGYGETSKMLAESALCLALDRRRLNPVYGVVTPASVMGRPLYERLQSAGIEFRVLELSP